MDELKIKAREREREREKEKVEIQKSENLKNKNKKVVFTQLVPVNIPPSSYPTYPGGAPINLDILNLSMY